MPRKKQMLPDDFVLLLREGIDAISDLSQLLEDQGDDFVSAVMRGTNDAGSAAAARVDLDLCNALMAQVNSTKAAVHAGIGAVRAVDMLHRCVKDLRK